MFGQSHFLSEAIEERGTREVVDHNLAIEALKNEVETLEAKKTRLVGEVGSLRTARAELEELQKKVDSLSKKVEGAKAVERLAAERALKAIEAGDNLRRESGVALKAQVDVLSKRHEDAKCNTLGVALQVFY